MVYREAMLVPTLIGYAYAAGTDQAQGIGIFACHR